MPDNKRRHANGIAVGSVAKWALIAFFMGAIGLSYVYYKNQLHAMSNQIGALEEQLKGLVTENQVVAGRVAFLRSRAEVATQLKTKAIKMIPIQEERIVRLPGPGSRLGATEIRSVANEEARQ